MKTRIYISFIYFFVWISISEAKSYGSDYKVNPEIFSSYRYVIYSEFNVKKNYAKRIVIEKCLESKFEIITKGELKESSERIKQQTLVVKWRVTKTNLRILGSYSQEITIEFYDYLSQLTIYTGIGEYMGGTSAGDIKGALRLALKGLHEYKGFDKESFKKRISAKHIVPSKKIQPFEIPDEKTKVSLAITGLISKNIEKSHAYILTDKLRGELIKTNKFSIVERQEMDEILKEQGFQQTGCTSKECAVEIGQLIGVRLVLIGSVGKLE